MVQLALPKNSRVQPGKVFKAKPEAKNVKAFRIYRYDPEEGQNPRVDTFELDLFSPVRRDWIDNEAGGAEAPG